MATYLTEQQINAKLVTLVQKVDTNFAKKKDAITKIELLDLVAPLPSGVTDEGKYIVVTYVDHVNGTNEHKEYIKLEVGSGSGIIKFAIQQEMDDYLVGGKATVGDICFLDEKFYEIELDTNGDLAYNELLFLNETDRELLDSLKIEELKEDALDPDLVTGYILKFRGKQLFTEDNLCAEDIDFEDGESLQEKLDNGTLGGGDSATLNTTELTPNALGGISAGANLDGMTPLEILTEMLYPYVKPTVTATGTPNGGIFEIGDNKTITNVRVVVTKKSKKITKIEVFDGATSLGLLDDATIENGGTFDFPVNIEVASINKQLTANVTDEQGSEVPAKTGAFTFVSPYYVGVCDADATIDETLVTGLTKKIEAKATKTISYTTVNQKMVFAYPVSYGAISKIYDSNNFDVTNTFTKEVISITGLDGVAVEYNVYTNGTSSVSGFNMKFQY